jgi:hypothetical protein
VWHGQSKDVGVNKGHANEGRTDLEAQEAQRQWHLRFPLQGDAPPLKHASPPINMQKQYTLPQSDTPLGVIAPS